jgi:hypothetical protein
MHFCVIKQQLNRIMKKGKKERRRKQLITRLRFPYLKFLKNEIREVLI